MRLDVQQTSNAYAGDEQAGVGADRRATNGGKSEGRRDVNRERLGVPRPGNGSCKPKGRKGPPTHRP
jgi:hypothetical protein